MSYYLGVDGGASQTIAVIVDDEGNILGTGKSRNSNHQIDRDEAEKNINLAVLDALEQANVNKEQVSYAWFGLAGADRETDFKILTPIIDRLNFQRYEISCDTMIALRAGTTHPYGVVIICGSGVNSAGVNKQNTYYQCGGFGYMYGDFGGGSELAVSVFRSVIRAWDGRGEPTELTPLLLEMLNYTSVEEMLNDFLDHENRVPRDVAKLLFPAVQRGDQTARRVLEYQGVELGLSAREVIKKLKMERDAFDVVLAGSILTRSGDEIMKEKIQQSVQTVAPHSTLKTLKVEPVVGALVLAMEKAGRHISKQLQQKLRSKMNIGVI